MRGLIPGDVLIWGPGQIDIILPGDRVLELIDGVVYIDDIGNSYKTAYVNQYFSCTEELSGGCMCRHLMGPT